MVAELISTDRPLTIDDLDLLPDDGNRYELLQGELIVSPSPGGMHQEILGRLYVQILEGLKQSPVGRVKLSPFDVQLSDNDVVQPDLFVFRRSHAERYSDRCFKGAPSFVIEIVSASSGKYDRVRKAALYMKEGVEEYWVVEPIQKRILVYYQSDEAPLPKIVASGSLQSRVIPALEVELNELFAPEPD